ncbi:non-hydrolyzing UDP-N-acetylglucosamine 2-epimerase [Actinospica durhamensis]|uniref:non-hydrolyzing UDP-N-acetylglucosamine 2-epimerase n=1 Tax=Actinospica durhamensis TaxID=1508375 RepID=UPI0027DB6FC9|nr:UDP-N-acetylglucosamine 2-epimerase (non-hydrolyzing) [Actinospica durhamensis]
MRIVSVVGARPQFVKLAPIAAAVAAAGHEHVIVHTGQHYDRDLSEVFFSGLGIPEPDEHLAVGSGGHGAQTGAMLAGLEPVLTRHEPDWVLVYGDTNSTIAGALCAVKLHLPVAHLEAGLRSFNRRMPEEHNRVLTDHAADLLLAPTPQAVEHLRNEGLGERTVLVGDVMVDACLRARETARAAGLGGVELEGLGVDLGSPADSAPSYLLATIHRAENTDDPKRLKAVLDALADLPLPVVLLAHPRLRARAAEYGIELARGAVRPGTPLPYAQMIAAIDGAAGVVTDSGGLQKEAYLLGRPCTTVRTETEWPETLVDGWNVLAEPTAYDFGALAARPAPATAVGAPFGDGKTAERVVSELAARVH